MARLSRRLRFYSKCMGSHWKILHRNGYELIYNFNPNLGCGAGNNCGKSRMESGL